MLLPSPEVAGSGGAQLASLRVQLLRSHEQARRGAVAVGAAPWPARDAGGSAGWAGGGSRAGWRSGSLLSLAGFLLTAASASWPGNTAAVLSSALASGHHLFSFKEGFS